MCEPQIWLMKNYDTKKKKKALIACAKCVWWLIRLVCLYIFLTSKVSSLGAKVEKCSNCLEYKEKCTK